MSNANGNDADVKQSDPLWYRFCALLLHHLVAITAFLAALSALGISCNNHQVTQQHAGEIQENKVAIGEVKEAATVAVEKAEIAKDKAAVVEKKVQDIERKTDK